MAAAITTGSALLDPLTNWRAWSVIQVGDTESPGVIDKDGIEGFERETGWDVKKGKGAKGASLTLQTEPPSSGTIRFVLWKPSHFGEWAAFLPLLRYTGSAADKQAVAIYHPSLADLGITSVVVDKISPIRHVGMGRYIRTVKFIEWTPPPKASIVATPTRATEVTNPKPPGDPDDPVADRQQALIALLSRQAAAP